MLLILRLVNRMHCSFIFSAACWPILRIYWTHQSRLVCSELSVRLWLPKRWIFIVCLYRIAFTSDIIRPIWDKSLEIVYLILLQKNGLSWRVPQISMEWMHTPQISAVSVSVFSFQHWLLTFLFSEAGGKDESQGNVDYTFTRPDGTQLGNQGMQYAF